MTFSRSHNGGYEEYTLLGYNAGVHGVLSQKIVLFIPTVSFMALLVNWCNNGLLPQIREFFPTLNGFNEFMGLRL
jgi:hypothetical protein